MTGQALLRALMIIALIVTANAVKPFSVRNVTNHLFASANSFRIVMPDSAEVGLSNANLLALTLTQSWFADEEPVWYGENDVLAYQKQTETEKPAEAAPVRMSKAVIQRPPALRRTRQIDDEDGNLDFLNDLASTKLNDVVAEEDQILSPTAIAFSSEPAPIVETAALASGPAFAIPANFETVRTAPVSLPEIDGLIDCARIKVHPVIRRTIPFYWTAPRVAPKPAASCDELNNKKTGQIRLITLIEEKKSRKLNAVLTSMLECEDETTEINSIAETSGTSEGPSIEFEFTSRVLPLQITPDELNSCNPMK